jgi:hypothetical protein
VFFGMKFGTPRALATCEVKPNPDRSNELSARLY